MPPELALPPDVAGSDLGGMFGPFVPAIAGGLILGVASAALFLLTGRIAGVSGVLGGLLQPRSGDFGWRLSFFGGLLLAGLGAAWLAPAAFGAPVGRGPGLIVLAGLLVGVGTRLGNGCTSGHGVCGISRGSPRSIASVLTFMFTGILTATLLRVLGEGA